MTRPAENTHPVRTTTPRVHLPIPMVIAATLAACGADLDGPSDKPDGQGTEIGDEGGEWLCVEDSVEVTDLEAELPSLGAAPDDLLAAHLGASAGDDLRLQLDFAGGQARFFDMAPADWGPADATPPVCLDQLGVEVTVALEAPGLRLDTPAGWLSVSEGGGVSFSASVVVHEDFRVDPDDDEPGVDEGGSAEPGAATCATAPGTFSMDEMMWVSIVVDGVRSGDTWALQARWVGDTQPIGEDAEVLSLEEPIWSGTATDL